jgi:hypothetical protein
MVRAISSEDFVASRKEGRMAKTTTDELLARCKENFGDKFTILGTTFRTVHDKIPILCNDCGRQYDKRINDLLHGYGCSSCAGLTRRTQEEFEAEVAGIDNGEYKPLTAFKSTRGKVRFLHSKCNREFEMKVHGFLTLGHRCPLCYTAPLGRNDTKGAREASIEFEREMAFEGLKGPSGSYLRFDFYVESRKLLIEFDGEQHEKPVVVFGGEKWHQRCVENDRTKDKWASDNGLTLVRISYRKMKMIPEILGHATK